MTTFSCLGTDTLSGGVNLVLREKQFTVKPVLFDLSREYQSRVTQTGVLLNTDFYYQVI